MWSSLPHCLWLGQGQHLTQGCPSVSWERLASNLCLVCGKSELSLSGDWNLERDMQLGPLGCGPWAQRSSRVALKAAIVELGADCSSEGLETPRNGLGCAGMQKEAVSGRWGAKGCLVYFGSCPSWGSFVEIPDKVYAFCLLAQSTMLCLLLELI